MMHCTSTTSARRCRLSQIFSGCLLPTNGIPPNYLFAFCVITNDSDKQDAVGPWTPSPSGSESKADKTLGVCSQREDASPAAIPSRSLPVPSQQRNEPIRFLVVDDSELNRKMNWKSIKSDPAIAACSNIFDADDGDTAVAALRALDEAGTPVDCILLDYVMLRMNGPEAAKVMRSELGYKGLIIAITGNVLAKDRDEMLAVGADYVLVKPLVKKALMDILYKEFGDRIASMELPGAT
jgi:CheY-like chemotaxis protein